MDAAVTALHAPAVRAVLYPFRLILAPLFATTSHDWLRAAWPAFAIVVVHGVWVLRTDTAFEEAAAENAARRARAMAARTHGGRVTPARIGTRRRFRLPLAPQGGPVPAFIWKNTLALGRTIATRTLIAMAIVLATVVFLARALAPDEHTAAGLVTRMALALCALLVVTGPMWVRNDLRLDLMQLEVLRSYPVRGATVVRAELGASLVILGGLQLVLVLLAYAIVPAGESLGMKLPVLSLSDRTALLLVTVVVLPVASALGLLVQNAGALLFPAWMRLGLSRPGGIEAIGQSILTMFGSVVALGLLGSVPAVIGGVLAVLAVSRFGLWGALPGVVVGALLVVVELWWITAWLGRIFERTESVGEAGADAARY